MKLLIGKPLGWVVLIVVCVLCGATVTPQGTHPTTPGLTSSEATLDLSVADAMKRAGEALRAAGLVLHKPMPEVIGGSNEWVAALINCSRVDGKTRVIATAACHPTKLGESYRTCIFLIEFMKTGKAPANSGLTGSVIGVWEWSWVNAIGTGKSRVTLQADGKVTCPDPGWAKGDWWIEGGKVLVYWPTSFPKTNLHYVMQFTISEDGRQMSTSGGNYYFSSVVATRMGDAPGSAIPGETPPATGAAGTPAGFSLPEPGASDNVLRLEAPTYPPPPLPLPPVGAGTGTCSPSPFDWSPRGELADGPRPAQDLRLNSVKASEVRLGVLQVEAELSAPEVYSHIDVYVSGYLRFLTTEFGTIRNAGTAPAYAYIRNGERTARRTCTFPVPQVLPAKVRVELYESPPGGPRRFIAQKEILFDLPYPDYATQMCGVFGDKDKGIITKVAAIVSAGTESWSLTVPGGTQAQAYDNDFVVSGKFTGSETSFTSSVVKALGRPVRWKEALLTAWPMNQDRDLRNNRIWPNLPNKGYLDQAPVWVGF